MSPISWKGVLNYYIMLGTCIGKIFLDFMHIIDNFFKDPYSVRRLALSLKDKYRSPNSNDLWPGLRCDVPELLRSPYESKIKKITQDNKLILNECSFQYVNKSHLSGSSHIDPGRYTCITYLNENAPSNSGTLVYDERWDNENLFGRQHKINDFGIIKGKFYTSDRTLIDRFKYSRELNKINSLFENPCAISNKFNRTLIFDSDRVHRAQHFFGSTIKDARLTLVSFFGRS